jgi:hypothetical protein
LAAARAAYPDLFAIVDATEQSVERSQDAEQQQQHYLGKKKRHTRKVQIIVNEYGVVREVSDSVPGAVHDRELFRQSGAAEAIPKETVTGGDAGYQGIQDDLPDHSVITPFKKTKLNLLTEEQKLLNIIRRSGAPAPPSLPPVRQSRPAAYPRCAERARCIQDQKPGRASCCLLRMIILDPVFLLNLSW